jgi:hypothetical protein
MLMVELGLAGPFAIMAAVSALAAFSIEFALQRGRDMRVGTKHKPAGMGKPGALQTVFEHIRGAQSWTAMENDLRHLGFKLVPEENDILVINFRTHCFALLSDSGHFLPFIIERLGTPPEHLLPHRFKQQKGTEKHADTYA